MAYASLSSESEPHMDAVDAASEELASADISRQSSLNRRLSHSTQITQITHDNSAASGPKKAAAPPPPPRKTLPPNQRPVVIEHEVSEEHDEREDDPPLLSDVLARRSAELNGGESYQLLNPNAPLWCCPTRINSCRHNFGKAIPPMFRLTTFVTKLSHSLLPFIILLPIAFFVDLIVVGIVLLIQLIIRTVR